MEGMKEGNLLFGGPEDRRLYYEVIPDWVRARAQKEQRTEQSSRTMDTALLLHMMELISEPENSSL